MADDPHNTSDISDHIPLETKEDAETAAAREELKQTAISERAAKPQPGADVMATASATDKNTARTKTPEREIVDKTNDSLKDQVSSPKKKRAHDQVDEPKDVGTGEAVDDSKSANGSAAGSRTDRSEPEKKRARDEHASDDELSKDAEGSTTSRTSDKEKTTSAEEKPVKAKGSSTSADDTGKHKQPTTSSAAFASSGFSKLAASATSPFGALGASSGKSIFGGSSSSPSPFGALGASTTPAKPATPTLNFGNGDKTGSASPFASLNGASKGFGSAFGSGFGSALTGSKLTSFAKPGETFKSDKPAKPFGAPESDAEDGSGEDDQDEEGGAEEADKESEEAAKDDSKPAADDKKKLKLQKVVVDDGEAGEVTILQVRAKMYALDKTQGKDGKEEAAWKERGVGNLKINVPEECVEFDENGAAIPDSFDASVLQADADDDEEAAGEKRPKVVRLILRQDSTLRVILNTAIWGHTEFQEKSTLKSSNIIFTAFEEGGKVVNVQMKMNPANAKTFLDRVDLIKRELMS